MTLIRGVRSLWLTLASDSSLCVFELALTRSFNICVLQNRLAHGHRTEPNNSTMLKIEEGGTGKESTSYQVFVSAFHYNCFSWDSGGEKSETGNNPSWDWFLGSKKKPRW